MAEHEQLLRFVTRHQFGHVFGWEDDTRGDRPTALAVALRESDADSLVLTAALLRRYRFTTPYGHKPSGSLTTTTGSCLSPLQDSLGLLPCSDPGSGRFNLAGGQVASRVAASGCLGATLDDPVVQLESCHSQPNGAGFSMLRARWATPDQCVMPETAAAGSPVITAPCAPVGDPSQAWHFDIIGQGTQGSTLARLRVAATGHCLGMPEESANSGDVLILKTCDEPSPLEHVFQLWPDGQMSIGSDRPSAGNNVLCLNWDAPQSVVYLGGCSFDEYWFSSALETSAGLALTLTVDQGSSELRVTELAPSKLPSDQQIFDYVF
jgi:hypothetical protein